MGFLVPAQTTALLPTATRDPDLFFTGRKTDDSAKQVDTIMHSDSDSDTT